MHPKTLFHCSKNYYRTKIIKYSPQYFIFCGGSCYYSQQIYLCSLFAFKVLMWLIISLEFVSLEKCLKNDNAGQCTGKPAVKPGNTLKLDHQVSYSRTGKKKQKQEQKPRIFLPMWKLFLESSCAYAGTEEELYLVIQGSRMQQCNCI